MRPFALSCPLLFLLLPASMTLRAQEEPPAPSKITTEAAPRTDPVNAGESPARLPERQQAAAEEPAAEEAEEDLERILDDLEEEPEGSRAEESPLESEEPKIPREEGIPTTEEVAPIEEGDVREMIEGWTPIELGLFSPLQALGGRRAVYGLRLGLLYTRNPEMAGLDLGLGLNRTDLEGWGLAASASANWTERSFAGLQIAGIGNVVHLFPDGDRTDGDRTRRSRRGDATLRGLQIGGIGNLAENLAGVQIGGFANLVKDFEDAPAQPESSSSPAYGMVISAGGNAVERDMYGVQVALLVNGAIRSEDSQTQRVRNVWGLQASLLWNVASVSGLQVSASNGMRDLLNAAQDHEGPMEGLQVGLLYNCAKDVAGVQVAGLSNEAESISGLQVSLSNHARLKGVQIGIENGWFKRRPSTGELLKDPPLLDDLPVIINLLRRESRHCEATPAAVDGLQLGAFMNGATELEGVQIAGVMNRSYELWGVQMAPLNSAGLRGGGGCQIGAMNITGAHGEPKTEPAEGKSEGGSRILQLAGVNISVVDTEGGAQVGGLNLSLEDFAGAQLGAVNLSVEDFAGVQVGGFNWCEQGSIIQIGLINVHRNGFLPVFPLFNFRVPR